VGFLFWATPEEGRCPCSFLPCFSFFGSFEKIVLRKQIDNDDKIFDPSLETILRIFGQLSEGNSYRHLDPQKDSNEISQPFFLSKYICVPCFSFSVMVFGDTKSPFLHDGISRRGHAPHRVFLMLTYTITNILRMTSCSTRRGVLSARAFSLTS